MAAHLIRKQDFRGRAMYAGLALAVAIGTVASVFVLLRSSSAEDLSVGAISAESLAEFSVRLEEPSEGETASIGRQQALESALAEHPGGKVEEGILARIYAESDLVRDGQLVWAVSLDPSSVEPAPGFRPGSSEPARGNGGSEPKVAVTFAVEFVDAESGKVLMGLKVTHDPSLPD